jgi:hypothetical protein
MANKIPFVAASVMFGVTAAVWAGPEFDEGATDAGSTPPTSKPISSSSGAPVQKISGATSTAALIGEPDLVDLYLVKTGSDTSTFKVDMNMVPGGAPQWSARLCLFKKEVKTCTTTGQTVTLARPIATVVKANSSQAYPIFDGLRPLVNGGGATLGSILEANTEYYLAVSGSAILPLVCVSDCGCTSPIQLFGGTTIPGQYRANVDEMRMHLVDWIAEGTTTAGVYNMPTSGVRTVVASDCSTAMELVGAPLSVPYDYQQAPAVNVPTVSCRNSFTQRQFFYVWTPQCTGTARVSTCVPNSTDTLLEVFEICGCGDVCSALDTCSIACQDDCLVGGSYGSLVEFDVTAGRRYLVWMPLYNNASPGSGMVEFDCIAPPPSGDVNGDGVVNATDLSIILGQWGGQ